MLVLRYAAGLYDVSVTNLPIVGCCGCLEAFKGQILFVPGPDIEAVTPDVLCVVDDARDMNVTGERFMMVDNAPSELFLKPETTHNVSGKFRSADGCSSLTLNNHNNGACAGALCNNSHTADLCNHYAVEVPKAPTQTVDNTTVTLGSVHAEDRCTADANLILFPPPAIFDVFPPAIVYGQTHEVLLSGENFLGVDSVPPRIFLRFDDGQRDDQAIPYADVTLQSCHSSIIESAYSKRKVAKCTQAKIQLNASGAPIGLYTVRIENPAPILGSDIQTVSGKIQVVAKPQLYVAFGNNNIIYNIISPPVFPSLLPLFRLYGELSLHRCVRPYTCPYAQGCDLSCTYSNDTPHYCSFVIGHCLGRIVKYWKCCSN